MTQALSDSTQHRTWVLLVWTGFILSDYDRQESRDQHIQSLELGRAKIALYPTSQTPKTLFCSVA